jgi:phosphoglycolate phosphatase-like HAD superfamily hydrolase
MTAGEAYRAKLITDDALDAAIAAYLADPSQPAMLEIGDKRLDIAAAVLANAYSVEVLAREGVTGPQRRNAVKTAILLASI